MFVLSCWFVSHVSGLWLISFFLLLKSRLKSLVQKQLVSTNTWCLTDLSERHCCTREVLWGLRGKKKKDHLTLYCKVHTRHLSSNPAVSNSELFTLWCTLERRKFTSMFCSLYVCLSMLYNYHSLMPLTLHCLILEDDAFLKDAFCTNSRNRSRRDFTTHCTNMNKQKNPVGSVQ